MRKSISHVIFALCDIFVAIAIYVFVYQPTLKISSSIAYQAEFIRYNTHMYIVLIGIVIPGHHLIILVGTFLPKYSDRFVYIVYSFFFLSMLFGIGMTIKIKHDIKRNGYYYCEAASKHAQFSHFAVYVLDEKTCDRLVMEKTKH